MYDVIITIINHCMFLVVLCVLSLAHATTQQSTCSFSLNGYHVILDQHNINPSIARPACQAYGWEYAIVDLQSWQEAAWTVSNCTGQSVGIWSYHGIQYTGSASQSCQYMQGSGVFGVGTGGFDCGGVGMLPLLCEDALVTSVTTRLDLTTSTTLSSTSTIISQTTTSTTTTVSLISSTTSTVTVSRLLFKNTQQSICSDTANGMYLLMDAYTNADADAACQANGWELARFSSVDVGIAKTLWTQCQPWDATAWFRSVEGITTGQCVLLYQQSEIIFWALISEGTIPCSLGTAMVLCRQPESNSGSSGTNVSSVLFASNLQLPTSTILYGSTSTWSITITQITSTTTQITSTVTIYSTTRSTYSTTTTTTRGGLVSTVVSIVTSML